MPKNTDPQASAYSEAIVFGDLTITVRAGSGVASLPAEDGLTRDQYTHVQVETDRLDLVPEHFQVYFDPATGVAPCMANEVLADLIAKAKAEQ